MSVSGRISTRRYGFGFTLDHGHVLRHGVSHWPHTLQQTLELGLHDNLILL